MKSEFEQRIRRVRLAIFDVDGVMTDGRLYYGPSGESMKAFNSQDGYGLKALQRADIGVAVISGRDSGALRMRLRDLGIAHSFLGIDDKILPFRQLLERLRLKPEQVAVMGDDLPDAAIMAAAGLALTVPDADREIRRIAHWVSERRGGEGAVRDACNLLLAAHA